MTTEDALGSGASLLPQRHMLTALRCAPHCHQPLLPVVCQNAPCSFASVAAHTVLPLSPLLACLVLSALAQLLLILGDRTAQSSRLGVGRRRYQPCFFLSLSFLFFYTVITILFTIFPMVHITSSWLFYNRKFILFYYSFPVYKTTQ